jgi:hypothetical protein
MAIPTDVAPNSTEIRRSQRKRKAPDFLRPKFKGKTYVAMPWTRLPRKQRVPTEWAYAEKERVIQPNLKVRRLLNMKDASPHILKYQNMFWQYREQQRARWNQRAGWWTFYNPKAHSSLHAMTATRDDKFYERNMPPSKLKSIFPNGPLNLNPDGTNITYKKAHLGPNAAHWMQADMEEMERLFKSGTLRSILHSDIPEGRNVRKLKMMAR